MSQSNLCAFWRVLNLFPVNLYSVFHLYIFVYFLGIPVLADEPTTMVITPSRFEQDIKQVGSSITVISKAEIKSKKQHTFADLLRSVEGVQVIQSGGQGSITSVFMRGSSSSQVLVMVDGVPINEVNSGQFDLADISTLGIERIEILRGPQSVVYGSSALGGVINIITERGDKDSASFLAEAGSYGTQKYTAQGAYNLGEVSGGVGASFFDTHNISQANAKNGNSEKDPYQNNIVNANLAYTPSQKTKVAGSFRYTRGKAELDGFDYLVGAADSADYKQLRETYLTSIQAETSLDFWSPKLILGYNEENYRATDPDVDFNNYQLKSNTTSLQQQNLFKINEIFSSLAGYSYQQNDGDNVGSYDKSRHVNSVFIEQFINLPKGLNLSLGGRHDDDSTFGEEFTYRGSLAQQIDPIYSRLHTSYGTGYRAPSFSDLYFPNFSNPGLDPETSRGYDVGLASEFKFVSTDITFFYTKYSDLISFNDTTFLPENIQNARTQGVESKINFDLCESTSLGLSYTYLDARNKTTNTLLPRRARHQGGISVTNSYIENITLRSDITLSADRIESDGSSMDDYVVVSGVAQYSVTEQLSPYIRVQNLFDRDYEEVNGYGTLGASVFGGIEYRM